MTDCWLWEGQVSPNGYGRMPDGKRYAHRVAWSTFHEREIPEGMWVLHTCDVRACVNPSHLFLGSPRDNAHDMVEKGRHYSPFSREERARHGFAPGGPC